MTFGIARGVAVDSAGNVLEDVWVEVRRMTPGHALAIPLYADADGADTLDNPFFAANGEFAFYAVGGTYRVRAYKTGYDKTWDDVPVGTAQGADVDHYAQSGFTWAPESATSTPPSDGCIRFNDADVSLATHVYLDQDTLGGSDVATWLSSLSLGDWLLMATGVATEVGWPVISVTDAGAYFDIEIDQTNYAGPAGPLGFGDSGFVTVAQQRQASSNAGTEQVITATGTTAISSTTSKVIINLSGSGAVTLTLGAVASRGGLPLVVSDYGGNADITITPNGTEKIMGLSSAELVSSAQGLGSGVSITLYPKASPINGWYSA